jgi:hypothetical protein
MRATIFNIISVIFFFLTLASATFTVSRLVAPEEPFDVAALPTIAPDLPTLTPSLTHTPTFPPTFTPTPTLTPTLTPTFTLTSTLTLTPSVTPSRTITNTPGPTETPSASPEPSPTETPTGPSPTPEPSPDPFLFRLQQNVIYGANVYNTLGCNWQGVGGRAFDLNRVDLVGPYQVRVFNNSFDRVVFVGSNTLYGGPSGWEIQTDSTVNTNSYFVRLETANNTPLTPNIQITFTANCAANLATINFEQQRAP